MMTQTFGLLFEVQQILQYRTWVRLAKIQIEGLWYKSFCFKQHQLYLKSWGHLVQQNSGWSDPLSWLSIQGACFEQTQALVGRNLKSIAQPIDWAITGHVSQVKNQGNCGFCWAFVTVGALKPMIQLFFDNGWQFIYQPSKQLPEV